MPWPGQDLLSHNLAKFDISGLWWRQSKSVLSWPVIIILVLCVAIGTLNISYLTWYTATKPHRCYHTAVKITLVTISPPEGTDQLAQWEVNEVIQSETLSAVSASVEGGRCVSWCHNYWLTYNRPREARRPGRAGWAQHKTKLSKWLEVSSQPAGLWRTEIDCRGDWRWLWCWLISGQTDCVYTFLARSRAPSVSISPVSSSPTSHQSHAGWAGRPTMSKLRQQRQLLWNWLEFYLSSDKDGEENCKTEIFTSQSGIDSDHLHTEPQYVQQLQGGQEEWVSDQSEEEPELPWCLET